MNASASQPIVLIGAGIMSATLAVLLKSLDPNRRIWMFEMGREPGLESSSGWSNAGTGHAGYCEITYTPHRAADGSVNVAKAVEMLARFERSKQFWAYAVRAGIIGQPGAFVRPLPHMSFVRGQDQVEFLRSRFEGLRRHPGFAAMQFTTDPAAIARWAPLLVEGQDPQAPVAATWIEGGTDVNFGALTRKLVAWTGAQTGDGVLMRRRVVGLSRSRLGWKVTTKDQTSGNLETVTAGFVFVGAGGGTLPLLQMAGLPEAKGFAGFPIGGQWLVCDRPDVVARHGVKAYGQAVEAAPSMGGPHLDLRMIDGQSALLFGPFASMTTKYLQNGGTGMDLFSAVRPSNLSTLLGIGMKNLPLVRYLGEQATQSMEARMDSLRTLYPLASRPDWRLLDAGIRVQTIKPADAAAGVLNFGTEVVSSEDRTLFALLGASPGASVSADVALQIVERCFPELASDRLSRERLDKILPTWNRDLTQAEEYMAYKAREGAVNQRLLGLAPVQSVNQEGHG
jgi:malate dehydrogenase (quinone)